MLCQTNQNLPTNTYLSTCTCIDQVPGLKIWKVIYYRWNENFLITTIFIPVFHILQYNRFCICSLIVRPMEF